MLTGRTNKIYLFEITEDEFAEKIAEIVFSKIQPFLSLKESGEYKTRKEAANILRISLPTLHSWTKKGLIKAYRVSGSNRIRYKQLDLDNALIEKPSLK